MWMRLVVFVRMIRMGWMFRVIWMIRMVRVLWVFRMLRMWLLRELACFSVLSNRLDRLIMHDHTPRLGITITLSGIPVSLFIAAS